MELLVLTRWSILTGHRKLIIQELAGQSSVRKAGFSCRTAFNSELWM
jgi:hypothetical protein